MERLKELKRNSKRTEWTRLRKEVAEDFLIKLVDLVENNLIPIRRWKTTKALCDCGHEIVNDYIYLVESHSHIFKLCRNCCVRLYYPLTVNRLVYQLYHFSKEVKDAELRRLLDVACGLASNWVYDTIRKIEVGEVETVQS